VGNGETGPLEGGRAVNAHVLSRVKRESQQGRALAPFCLSKHILGTRVASPTADRRRYAMMRSSP
jgi:hypothetical protein